MSKPPSLQERSSGILLHPTSLPGPYAIGDLGPGAYSFIDFLAASGQRWWQTLPVTPIGAGNSPYHSFSSFAGNTLLISPDLLVRDGWLDHSDLAGLYRSGVERVHYNVARDVKRRCLWRAFERFEKSAKSSARQAFDRFCHQEAAWLDDYALFSALRFHHHGKEWTQWGTEWRMRRPSALAKARRELARDRRYHQFVQWQFLRQWEALRQYADRHRIGLLGDVPIFVSPNSSDVWSHQDLFKLRKDGRPDVVAGVPPDYFSRTGQLWGNPLYRWDAHRRQGYRWWMHRLRHTFRYFHAVRIDHFIGFVRYYEVPTGHTTAEKGRYRPGPGADFFKSVFRQMGPLELVAEDLGRVTPEVEQLRDQFQLPGMKVLQFAFGKGEGSRSYLPHRYSRRAVVYTGTHDNNTTAGWLHDDAGKDRELALAYLRSNARDIHWDLIRCAYQSVASTAIVPMQDVLGLGSAARMNRPGTASGNWEWRMRPDAPSVDLASRLRQLAEMYERI